jgi:hypothetical protein
MPKCVKPIDRARPRVDWQRGSDHALGYLLVEGTGTMPLSASPDT